MEWIALVILAWGIVGFIITILQLGVAIDSWAYDIKPWQAPIYYILYVWDETRKKYNLAGCVLIAILMVVGTLPAVIMTTICLLVYVILVRLPGKVFNLLFKKR